MDTTTIRSLDDLLKYKRKLRKEIELCEEEISEEIHNFTYPFSSLFSTNEIFGQVDKKCVEYEDISPFYDKIRKIVVNTSRLVQVFNIAKNIYSDLRNK